MRTNEVGIVSARVRLVKASVRLTQLVLVLFSRSPPDATASTREMDRSWPNCGATECYRRRSFRGGPWVEPGRVGGLTTARMRARHGRLSGHGGAGPPAARQPPVPVPVRCTGSRAAQRTGQVAKRWLGCPDGVCEASCCACNGMALSCVFSSLGSQCCALRPLPRASAG